MAKKSGFNIRDLVSKNEPGSMGSNASPVSPAPKKKPKRKGGGDVIPPQKGDSIGQPTPQMPQGTTGGPGMSMGM